MNKIIVPDAAIKEFNEKYGKYLQHLEKVVHPPVIDEDAMYLKYMIGESNEKK